MATYEISVNVPDSATSSVVAISGASAQSAAFGDAAKMNNTTVLVSPSVDCFVRQGSNPTAVANGTDMLLRGAQTYRVLVAPGNKLAFITSGGAGNVYLTPAA